MKDKHKKSRFFGKSPFLISKEGWVIALMLLFCFVSLCFFMNGLVISLSRSSAPWKIEHILVTKGMHWCIDIERVVTGGDGGGNFF